MRQVDSSEIISYCFLLPLLALMLICGTNDQGSSFCLYTPSHSWISAPNYDTLIGQALDFVPSPSRLHPSACRQ